MDDIFSLESLVAFTTLLGLELVLGIDNIIFISILSSKLPVDQQKNARTLGLSLAVITRILLLLSISWVVGLTEPLFELIDHQVSGRDLILLLGGLFLIAKSTHEIHQKLESAPNTTLSPISGKGHMLAIIVQILLLDIVFSLDSVITAVGMVNQISIMVAAVIVSTLVMILTSESLSQFVEKHPTLKMLALSFLLLIGVTLLVEGLGQHISKGYIYFAIGFSLFVEMLNLKLRKKSDPIHLRKGL